MENPNKRPLDYTEHRTFPLPKRPYAGHMTWQKLLFAHWAVDPEVVRPLIPAGLALDTFDGKPWIGVVPFYMTGVRPRFVPSIPGFSQFAELNVRTYVTAEDKPGVWFFSLDAANRIAVWGARTFFYLPYFNAKMACRVDEAGKVHYESRRTHKGAPGAEFRGTYYPVGDVYYSRDGTLDHFLTERYCLYAAKNGQIYRSDIHHLPWALQPAACEIELNTMAHAAGIDLPDVPPLLHYSDYLNVLVWTLEKV